MKVRNWGVAKSGVITDEVVIKVVTGEIIGIIVTWLFLCRLLPR
jgi:hypothetical protein